MILRDIPLGANVSLSGDCIPMAWLESKELASISISGIWKWYTTDKIEVGSSTDSDIKIEDGFIVTWDGWWKWNKTESQKSPVLCFGDFSSDLPQEDEKQEKTFEDITSDKKLQESISAPKDGMEVINGRVVKATGNLISTSKISVTFLNRSYFGYTSSSTISQETIKSLSRSFLTAEKNTRQNNVTSSTDEYVVYAYPSAFGDLTSIVQDNAFQVLGAFRKNNTTIKVINDAGIEIDYIAYISNNCGAFSNATLDFK